MSGDGSIPEKRSKPEIFTQTGYYEFPSASIAQIIYHSFAHDEDAPRAKGEKQLEIDGNRITFVATANNEKSLGKALDSLNTCVTLSQEVLSVGSKFGGNLSEQEKQGISQPVVRVFT